MVLGVGLALSSNAFVLGTVLEFAAVWVVLAGKLVISTVFDKIVALNS